MVWVFTLVECACVCTRMHAYVGFASGNWLASFQGKGFSEVGAVNPYHGSISFPQVISSGSTEVLKIFDLRTICCLNLGWEEEGRMGVWAGGCAAERYCINLSVFTLTMWDLLTLSQIPLWGLVFSWANCILILSSALGDHGFLHLFFYPLSTFQSFAEIGWNPSLVVTVFLFSPLCIRFLFVLLCFFFRRNLGRTPSRFFYMVYIFNWKYFTAEYFTS